MKVPAWLADVVTSVLIIAAAFLPSPVAAVQPVGSWTTVIVLLPLVILPFRRLWPRIVLASCLALFGLSALTGTLSVGIGLAAAVAMFHLVTVSTRRTGFVAAGIAAVTIVLLALPETFGQVFDPRALQFGLIIALAATAGDGARSHRAYIAAMTERAERAERTREAEAQRRVSEDRLRIARDLHDVVAHQIAVISLNAGVASTTIDAKPDNAKAALATIRGASRTVLSEIGDLLSMLRTVDDTEGSGAFPHPGLDRLEELIAQFSRNGLSVTFRSEGDISQVSTAVGVVAYRVAQEALTNAHKHGSEHRAVVLVEAMDTQMVITITNPLQPTTITTPFAADSSRLGLLGLRERVASVRGVVEAGPAPSGWTVTAKLPLLKEATR